jgi:hypothetical protein
MKIPKTSLYKCRNNSNHFINNCFNGNSFPYNDTGRLETLYFFYFDCIINYL